MEDKVKSRIVMFYIGAILNALFGVYVFVEGPGFLPPDQVRWLSVAFLIFTVINFAMGAYLRRKLAAALAARRAAGGDAPPAS